MYYTQPTDMLKHEYVEIGTEETRTLERVTARVFISSTVRHKVILKSDIENKLPVEKYEPEVWRFFYGMHSTIDSSDLGRI